MPALHETEEREKELFEVVRRSDVRLERRQDPWRWISRSYLDRRHD